MICSRCGKEFNGKFCEHCGAPAPSSATPIPGTYPTEPTPTKKKKNPIYKRWWFYVIVVIAAITVISSISINKSEKIKWDDMILSEQLPEPPKNKGEIHENTAEKLWVDINKISDKQYNDYTEACKAKGFTVDPESNSMSYGAYNSEGYKLSLSHYGNNKEMSIKLETPMVMEAITWPDSKIAGLLPIPKSTIGKIFSNDNDSFSVYIGNTTIDDYNAYVKACEEKGFTVDAQKEDKTFSAKNADSYKLSVDYKGNNIIYISIAEPEFDVTIKVECVENLMFSKYDVKMSIDDNFEGTIAHGDSKTFDVVLKRGTHNISFESAEDDTLNGEVKVEITKEDTIKLKISCSGSGINVKHLSGTDVKKENSSETTSGTDNTSQIGISEPNTSVENLTIDNCPELAAILSNKAEIDQSYSDFAYKYSGRIIEFDGRIDYCSKHDKYKTRFDYLVSAGDYDPNHQVGPSFKFEDVNYYDLNTDLDTVSVGLNVRITAKVISFDSNSGLFYLKPVSVKGR